MWSYKKKYNICEASKRNFEIAICGCIFRDNLATFLDTYSAKIGDCTFFQTELHEITLAIKYVNKKNWLYNK